MNNGGCSHQCVNLGQYRGIICTCPTGEEISKADRYSCMGKNLQYMTCRTPKIGVKAMLNEHQIRIAFLLCS